MCQIRSNTNLGVLRQRKEAKIWIMLKGKTMNLVWSQIRNDLREKDYVGRDPKGISMLGAWRHKTRPERLEK